MKKFLYAAAIALAFCATQARAEGFQVDSVRVGPASDEKTVDAAEAPAPKTEKAAPGRRKGKAKAARATKAARSTKTAKRKRR